MTETLVAEVSAEQAPVPAGYDASRLNATRHGILSRFTVLPWEDAGEYQALHATLVAEHDPTGTIEAHLVEEIAGVLWRKRRLRLAEAAAHRRGLNDALGRSERLIGSALAHVPSRRDRERPEHAVRLPAGQTESELADLTDDEAMTRRALDILAAAQRNDAYEAALAALRQDSQDWWGRELARKPEEYEPNEQPYTADAASLQRFIDNEIMPWFAEKRRDLAERPQIQAQAFGESLDPDRLERLGKYEVHLDRKLERTLSTLIRLQELRRAKPAAAVEGEE